MVVTNRRDTQTKHLVLSLALARCRKKIVSYTFPYTNCKLNLVKIGQGISSLRAFSKLLMINNHGGKRHLDIWYPFDCHKKILCIFITQSYVHENEMLIFHTSWTYWISTEIESRDSVRHVSVLKLITRLKGHRAYSQAHRCSISSIPKIVMWAFKTESTVIALKYSLLHNLYETSKK